MSCDIAMILEVLKGRGVASDGMKREDSALAESLSPQATQMTDSDHWPPPPPDYQAIAQVCSNHIDHCPTLTALPAHSPSTLIYIHLSNFASQQI